MNTEIEILKTLSTPAGIGMILVWMNVRLNRVESRLDLMADHIGSPKPQKKRGLTRLCVLGCAFALLAVAGCAMTHQTVTRADGEQTESRVYAVWPATTTLATAGAKQSKTTQSIGLSGAELDGGGTNLVEALKEARQIIQTVAGAAK